MEGTVLENDSLGSHPHMAVGQRKDRQDGQIGGNYIH